MKRGEIWTVAGGPDYTGKARPAVIVRDDRFPFYISATICPITSDPADTPLIRPILDPSAANGLQRPSRVMIDKVTTVRTAKLRKRIGTLDESDLVRLNRALITFLGLAG